MIANIESLEPKHFEIGTTGCKLIYKASSVYEGQGSPSIELSGSENIWLIKNGERSKLIYLDSEHFSSEVEIFEANFKIEVTQASQTQSIGFIKLKCVDANNDSDSDITSITYV